MRSNLFAQINTYVAWNFTEVLAGTFRRNKADFAHHAYPIVGPLPHAARNTPAIEQSASTGPYIYFVCDDQQRVCYVGKSQEAQVIHRWVRPGVGGPAKHYWTHSTKKGGCVFEIAKGIQSGKSKHYTLRYVPLMEIGQNVLASLGFGAQDPKNLSLVAIESALISALSPEWNLRF